MNNKFALPIQMYKKEEVVELENTNFHKVKIMIMHTGENFNGSVFSEESIDCSLNTLANIPILGFVETTSYGSRDFKGHEIDYDVYEDEDGNIKLRQYYKEVPIGVIPESNEFFKEEIDGEIYLGCYGYIWKSYSNDAYDILLEDRDKEVSMEILVKSCNYDRKNKCHINKFEFLGVTVLGSSTPGAMGSNCELTLDFSTDTEEQGEYALFSEKVVKLNNYLKGKESVSEVSEEQIKDIQVEFKEEDKEEDVCPDCKKNPCECDKEEEKEEFAEEEAVEESVEEFAEEEEVVEEEFAEKDEEEEEEEVCPDCKKNPCECEDEEDEEEFKCKDKKEKEKFAEEDKEEEDEEVCPDCKKNPCECEDEEEEEKEEFAEESVEEFSLSLNNIFKSLHNYLSSFTFEYTSFYGDVFECKKYYVQDLIPQNNIVILHDNELDEYYGANYSIENDDVVCDLDNLSVYIREWRAKESSVNSRFELEEKDVREAVFYNMIAKEYHELKDYKAQIEEAQATQELQEKVEEILKGFDFSQEEVETLVERVFDKSLSLEDFEEKLFALEGRKARQRRENFASHKETSNSLNITDIQEAPKGKYSSILEQYGKRNK